MSAWMYCKLCKNETPHEVIGGIAVCRFCLRSKK